MQPGLPNIQGSIGSTNQTGELEFLGDFIPDIVVGCFYTYGTASRYGVTGVHSEPKYDFPRDLCISATRSNTIYGASTTVQPPAIKFKLAIKY